MMSRSEVRRQLDKFGAEFGGGDVVSGMAAVGLGNEQFEAPLVQIDEMLPLSCSPRTTTDKCSCNCCSATKSG